MARLDLVPPTPTGSLPDNGQAPTKAKPPTGTPAKADRPSRKPACSPAKAQRPSAKPAPSPAKPARPMGKQAAGPPASSQRESPELLRADRGNLRGNLLFIALILTAAVIAITVISLLL